MAESKQHWLDRNRPTRVQITYDVEKGEAIEKKEIPFVVGVMSDLSGDTPRENKLKDRKFVQVDRDNFNSVLASVAPTLAFAVDNKLREDGTKLKIEMSFEKIDDFRPEAVIEQVPALKKLFEARQRLNDLLAKLEGNDELNKALIDIVADHTKLEALKSETSKDAPASPK